MAVAMVCLFLWTLCSLLCYQIMKSKGYPKETCINHGIGGFFLGVIWLIVDLFMCSYAMTQVVQNQSGPDELKKYKELLDDGVITESEFLEKKEHLLKSL